MGRDFLLPDLGEGLTEAEIVAWLVGPGDEVSVDQPVVELESAKSVVQLPTPFAGVVESLGGEVGQVLHAGSVLMTLSPSAPASAEPGVAAPAEAAAEESGAVLIGYGTRASVATTRASDAPARFGRRRSVAGGRGGRPATSPAPSGLDPSRRSPVVSPIVRRIAREHGFDASQLEGSGPDHLVMRRDVEAFVHELDGVRPAPSTEATEAPTAPAGVEPPAFAAFAQPDRAEETGDRRVPPPPRLRPPKAIGAYRSTAWVVPRPRTSPVHGARSPRRPSGWMSTQASSSPRDGSCRRRPVSGSA